MSLRVNKRKGGALERARPVGSNGSGSADMRRRPDLRNVQAQVGQARGHAWGGVAALKSKWCRSWGASGLEA